MEWMPLERQGSLNFFQEKRVPWLPKHSTPWGPWGPGFHRIPLSAHVEPSPTLSSGHTQIKDKAFGHQGPPGPVRGTHKQIDHCLDGQEPDLEGEAHPERWARPRLLDYRRLRQWRILLILSHRQQCWEMIPEQHLLWLDLRRVLLLLLWENWLRTQRFQSRTAIGNPALCTPVYPVLLVVFSGDRPNTDVLHEAFSLDWCFSSERGLILGSWDILLLWLDILWFLSEFWKWWWITCLFH